MQRWAWRGWTPSRALKTCTRPADEETVSTLERRELVQLIAALELEEHDLSARRSKLHKGIAVVRSEAQEQAERELSADRRDLHRILDMARADLERVTTADRTGDVDRRPRDRPEEPGST
jgi:hypothetical protein